MKKSSKKEEKKIALAKKNPGLSSFLKKNQLSSLVINWTLATNSNFNIPGIINSKY